MRGAVASLRTLVFAAFVTAVLPWPAAAQPRLFDSLYAFGDSILDTGNVLAGTEQLGLEPPVPPSESPNRTYYEGRFSNGPVAVDYLWQLLSGHAPETRHAIKPIMRSPNIRAAKAVNFAFGGTGTPVLDQTPGGFFAPGLKGQVELFAAALRGRKPSKRALYVIASGSNDYSENDFNVPMHPTEVVGNIVESVARLYQLGARTVMVFDLPDPKFFPGGDPDGSGSALAALHNELLAQGLAALAADRPDLRIIPIRVNDLFAQMPTLGFEATTPALALLFPDPPSGVPAFLCLFEQPAACPDANLDVAGQLGVEFLFWDVAHPTTAAHRVLGEYLFSLLTD